MTAAIKFNTTSGGSITFQPEDTSNNVVINLSATGTGTILQSSDIGVTVQPYDADLASWESSTVTLTNKTVNLSNNTLTGTIAQFNSACSNADFATLAGIETLSNKTLDNPTITNGYTEETHSADVTSTYTISLSNGTVQILTLTDNCTYTFPTPVAGKSFTLFQKQDATGSRTVTWDSNVEWPLSTAPTITSTANKMDVFSFISDGTNWYGRAIGQSYL